MAEKVFVHKSQSMADRVMGCVRDQTTAFMEAKQRARFGQADLQKERFKPKSKLLAAGSDAATQDSTTGSGQLLEAAGTQKKFEFRNFEEREAYQLPPMWIDMQEDVEDNLIQISNLFEELRPLRQSRFGGMMFDDQGAARLDKNISQLVLKIS